MRRYALILIGTFALAQPAWALFGTAELSQQMQAMQQQVDALDVRLGKLETAMQQNQQLLGLLGEVETLKAEIAKLRGQAEVQTHQVDTLGKRQNDLYADLDQRIADLAKASQPA
ncbi:MAG: YbgF trimerization domain-containing protein, partial [Thiobacillus sp.]